jgi:putative ABC transport system permease protein
MKTSPVLPRFLLRVGWRYLIRHFWQSFLMLVGITLGVAVAVGIDIANESARRAFELGTEAVTGRATHFISGGSQGIEESIYVDLKREGLDIHIAPLISDYATVPELGDVTFQLLGIDPFSEAPFRNYLLREDGVSIDGLSIFFTHPNSVLISRGLAEKHALSSGSRFGIEYSGRSIQVTVAGLLDPDDNLSRQGLEGLILMDIASAQELTGRLGQIDQIDVILPDNHLELEQVIQNTLPQGLRLQPVESRGGAVEQITAAFRLNLTALSLLALVVALFLIYNTMTFSVVQRRPLFGTLRSLGVTRKEVFLIVISEALLIGLLGAGLGTTAGILMGRGAVSLVSQTINDLFFISTVRDVTIPTISLIKGVLLGIFATVVAAAFPAWEAASVPPRTALSRANLESKAQRVIRILGIIGVLAIITGIGILTISSKSLILSFAGTFTVIIGFALITPTFTLWIIPLVAFLTSRIWGVIGRMAPREVVNSISRTSIATAALMMAIAVTIGFSLMVGSFRSTVETWMNQILHGDVYVSVPNAAASQPLFQIDPQVIEILEEWEGVERVDLLQSAVVDSPNGPIQVSANNNPNDGLEQLYLAAEYPPEEIWKAVEGGAVLVSEPLVNRLDLPLSNGQVSLYTDEGLRTFPIAGIYYDYSSSQGNVIFSLDHYRKIWDDDQVDAAALILEPGVDAQSTAEAIKLNLAPIQSLLVRSNQTLRAETLEVFDRTFSITGALQLITTVVAFIGVFSAMMSLQLDKQRQLGIFKAIGLTNRQMWQLVTLETGLMGAVAGLLSMPAGFILAVILVYIINRRSFGWTLQLQVTPEPFIQAFLIGVAAAVLAGLYPAYRIIQRNTAEAIRFD